MLFVRSSWWWYIFILKLFCAHQLFHRLLSPNSTWFVTSCLEATRYLAHAFGIGKVVSKRDRTCRGVSRFSAARHDTLVTTSATRTTRVQGRCHSVDWGGHVNLTVSRSCSWDWRKSRAQMTKLVHASTYCFFVVRHFGTSTAQHARHVVRAVSCRVETWRDEPSGI